MEYDFSDIPPIHPSTEWQLNCPDIVREYCRLAAMRSLSEESADRLNEILLQAESDGQLNFWITEADHFLAHELNMTNSESIYQFENQQAKLREYLRDLLLETPGQPIEDHLGQELDQLLKELQHQLKKRGLYPGAVDGVLGPKTYSAIVAFQEQNRRRSRSQASESDA